MNDFCFIVCLDIDEVLGEEGTKFWFSPSLVTHELDDPGQAVFPSETWFP